jgi:DNA-binding Xre family transcriptional regulator
MAKLRVNEIAKERGMNLSQLQRKADIAMRTARRYWFNTQSGNTTGEPLKEISFEVLGAIAKALEVRVVDLISEEDRHTLRAAMAGHRTARRAGDEAAGAALTVPTLHS